MSHINEYLFITKNQDLAIFDSIGYKHIFIIFIYLKTEICMDLFCKFFAFPTKPGLWYLQTFGSNFFPSGLAEVWA